MRLKIVATVRSIKKNEPIYKKQLVRHLGIINSQEMLAGSVYHKRSLCKQREFSDDLVLIASTQKRVIGAHSSTQDRCLLLLIVYGTSQSSRSLSNLAQNLKNYMWKFTVELDTLIQLLPSPCIVLIFTVPAAQGKSEIQKLMKSWAVLLAQPRRSAFEIMHLD